LSELWVEEDLLTFVDSLFYILRHS